MLDIRCNLKVDLEEYALKQLKRTGYSYRADLPMMLQCLNVLKREVFPAPRTVCIAPDLQCPTEHIDGFNDLVKSLKLGRNVNHYLSSNIKNAAFSDSFLNEFGLHHFHLGCGFEVKGKSAGFIKRTGPVMLAYLTETHAYVLSIKKHGKNGDPYIWVDDDVIECIHTHWPHVLEPFKAPGITLSGEKLSREDRKVYRRKAVNSFFEMKDGTVYTAPGGGITGAHTSVDAQHNYHVLIRRTMALLNYICDRIREATDFVRHHQIKLNVVSVGGCITCHDYMNRETYIAQEIEGNRIKYVHYIWGRWPDYYPQVEHLKVNQITMSMSW